MSNNGDSEPSQEPTSPTDHQTLEIGREEGGTDLPSSMTSTTINISNRPNIVRKTANKQSNNENSNTGSAHSDQLNEEEEQTWDTESATTDGGTNAETSGDNANVQGSGSNTQAQLQPRQAQGITINTSGITGRARRTVQVNNANEGTDANESELHQGDGPTRTENNNIAPSSPTPMRGPSQNNHNRDPQQEEDAEQHGQDIQISFSNTNDRDAAINNGPRDTSARGLRTGSTPQQQQQWPRNGTWTPGEKPNEAPVMENPSQGNGQKCTMRTQNGKQDGLTRRTTPQRGPPKTGMDNRMDHRTWTGTRTPGKEPFRPRAPARQNTNWGNGKGIYHAHPKTENKTA